jgi:hypothetical protein
MGKLFKRVILKILQQHVKERGLLNASQFRFCINHSTTLQSMRLTDHVTLNSNNKISTAAVFLDIEETFYSTCHSGLLYKLSKWEFSIVGQMSTPNEMRAMVPEGYILSPTLYNMYINDSPQTPGVYLALFADDTPLYATDRKQNFVVRKLQCGLNSIEKWCDRWNTKINEDKTRGNYFYRSRRPPESHLTLN